MGLSGAGQPPAESDALREERNLCLFGGKQKVWIQAWTVMSLPPDAHILSQWQRRVQCWTSQVWTSGSMFTGSLLLFVKSAGV